MDASILLLSLLAFCQIVVADGAGKKSHHHGGQSDVLFEPSLLVELKTGDEPTTAYFDFILAVE